MQKPALICESENFYVSKVQLNGSLFYEANEIVLLTLAAAQILCSQLCTLNHPRLLEIYKSTAEKQGGKTLIRTLYYYLPESLSMFLERYRPLPIDLLNQFISQLVHILAFLQSNDIHHASISPDSIFVTERKELKLAFFRSSLNQPCERYHKSTLMGQGRVYESEAKAVGVVIATLVAKQLPFELLFHTSESQLAEFIARLQVLPKVSVILTCLLIPSNYSLSFSNFKTQFEIGSLVPNPSVPVHLLSQCESCSGPFVHCLSCSHRFCANCNRNVCSICNTAVSTNCIDQSLGLEDQFRMLRQRDPPPSYSLQELRSIPMTISEKRYPLDTLSDLLPREHRAVVASLKPVYTSWRSSNCDGNSLFRCIGVAWLEKLFRSNCPDSFREKWLDRLKKRKTYFCATPESAHDFYDIISAILKIESEPRQSQLNALGSVLQSKEFDASLIVFVRTVTSNYISMHPEVVGSDCGCESRWILECCADDLLDVALDQWIGNAFKLSVTVFRVDTIKPLVVGEEKKSNSVALLYLEQRFALLYSVTQELLDWYSYHENKCNPRVEAFNLNCQYA